MPHPPLNPAISPKKKKAAAKRKASAYLKMKSSDKKDKKDKKGRCLIMGAGDYHGGFPINIGDNSSPSADGGFPINIGDNSSPSADGGFPISIGDNSFASADGGFPTHINNSDIIIAADGGLDRLRPLGIAPDVIIGDFDSVSAIPESGAGEVIALPRRKDDTDTLAAVRYGLERGFTRFHIWGGTGGRADHTAANIQTLVFISHRGGEGWLYGEGVAITALTGDSAEVTGKKGAYVSVFSHTDISEGVTFRGLRYPLEDATLTNDFPLGVSNEFEEERAVIEVKRGTLIIYISR